jgi:OTU domain-containing protein 6
MAGSKRNKLKKVLSPSQPTASPPMAEEDQDLMNDLMAELDSRDKTVQSESANVLNEMQINQQATAAEEARKKQDPKSRYQARQVSTAWMIYSC